MFILISVYCIFMFYLSSISVVKTNSRYHYICGLSLILPEIFLFLLIVFLFLLTLKRTTFYVCYPLSHLSKFINFELLYCTWVL